MAKEEAIEIDGVVEAVLPNTTFRVHLPNGHYVLATIAGKMRRVPHPALIGAPGPLSLAPYDAAPRLINLSPQSNRATSTRRAPRGSSTAGHPHFRGGAHPLPS